MGRKELSKEEMRKIKDFIRMMFNALFLQPIRGGNGVTQLDELGKYGVIWVTVWTIIYEGIRMDQQFTDVQFVAILSLLAGIIGVQLYFKNHNDTK